MIRHKKITIIGAGNVGATAAMWGARRNLGDIVLLDLNEGLAKGKALDLMQTGPLERFHSNIIGTNDYKDTKNSDIVIITAGFPRKPGMNRDDLREKNFAVIKSVVEKTMEYSNNPIIIMVTNPLDVMAYAAMKISGLPPQRIVGMAGILDSARMRAFIAMELGVSVTDVRAMVLGGHGDSMVPLPSHTHVGDVNIRKFLPNDKIKAIVERTRKGGGEIVSLLKEGSAYYAPASSVIEMADAIVKDRKRVLPCSAYLQGEYGVQNTYAGVPIVLGMDGVERVIELDLKLSEFKALQKSAKGVKEQIDKLSFGSKTKKNK